MNLSLISVQVFNRFSFALLCMIWNEASKGKYSLLFRGKGQVWMFYGNSIVHHTNLDRLAKDGL